MRGTSGLLRRRRTPAAPPCPNGRRYGEPRSPWSHGGQSRSAPSLNVRKEPTTPPPIFSLLHYSMIFHSSQSLCSTRKYSSRSSATRRTLHPRDAFPLPTPAPSDQGRVVGTAPAEGFGGGQHQPFPTVTLHHDALLVQNVGLPVRHLLRLVMTLNTLDYRRHPAIPFPRRIHWSTWHDTIVSTHHTCHF